MAQVTLTAIGSALGGAAGAAVGSTLGALVDRAAVDALRPTRPVGPRLTGLQLSSAAEGAPMPAVFGRARVAGQVIWAARFRERLIEERTGGGKGGPRTERAAYSLSLALAVGEGPIDGVGRVWADGKPMDLGGVVMRVHRGEADQLPDPLIEAVEGSAPAYRGTAYVVFEDLPLERYGNRPPQLSFEVFRRPASAVLEETLRGVCLIPGAGEFVYATDVVRRRESLTRTRAENVNNTEGRPDVLVALDQLQAQLPNVDSVTVVVSWFGDDLRAGECAVRPGVEAVEKETLPLAWRAGGVGRDAARLLVGADGRPAYGGTPSDASVLQLIGELKRRGLKVGLYPFLMMDVAEGNGLPDPYGGEEQAAYPWRGRITCHPAPGRPESPDRSVEALEQVERFFGPAAATDFRVVEGEPRYGGSDWGFGRMVLHYATLAQLAGGVDTFLIGSELRGLTWVRDDAGYPAVRALRRLAQEARALLPEAAISYAADWSEWFGHQPADGSGDVTFHLDPLWADPAVSFVGIDWYPPLTDWRDGGEHMDARAGFRGTHDPAYLTAGVAGGEGFDWFYASAADRLAQVRTPIADGAYGEPWVFRPKDLAGWWSHAHHDRPGGVRAAEPTAWVPQSKPIRFVEFGCPAIDKGANAPNLFVDPKSAESALPPFSDGTRDDLGLRRALEAVLGWFGAPQNNPASALYGGPMLEALDAWCWDARPFPAFPARSGTWADAGNWTSGHWLPGRTGVGPAAELITAVLGRGGVGPAALDLSQATGAVTGYVVDRPMPLRATLEPLLTVFGLEAVEQGGRIKVVAAHPAIAEAVSLEEDDLALQDGSAGAVQEARTLVPSPSAVRARFVDDAGEYALAAVTVTGEETGGGTVAMDLPVVTRRAAAERVARLQLAVGAAETEEATVALGPEAALRLEPGDRVRLPEDERPWRVLRVDADERPRARLARAVEQVAESRGGDDWRPGEVLEPPAPPVLHVLDLPATTDGDDVRPLLAVAGEPWRAVEVEAGASAAALTTRARAPTPATVGETLSDLPRGALHRWSGGALTIRIEGGVLQSRGRAEAAAGANALAVLSPGGEWELLHFAAAELIAAGAYRLTGLLRGQAGSDPAIADVTPAGASVVVLEGGLTRAEVHEWERDAPLLWRVTPSGGDAGSVTEASFTWRGLTQRPWSPAHLRGRRLPGGGFGLSWVRRARLGGDAWDREPPFGGAEERYRVEVLDGSGTVRSWEVTAPQTTYPPEQLAEDFPGGVPNPLQVCVRQWSAAFGWGAGALRNLWH